MTQSELFAQSSTPWRPHNYQKKAVKFLLEHACAALFLDPGLGKTSVTFAAIKFLKAKGLVDKVLIVAPLRVCHAVWPDEGKKWTDFEGLRVVVLHGKDKDELLKEDADIYVINAEGLPWLLDITATKGLSGRYRVELDLKRWKRLGFDTLVIDELSKFKHPQTQRFKALKHVLHTFGRRWGLTGSPASNGLMDLFGQCYVLDQGRSLGQYITHYRMKYFTPNFDGFSWDLKEGAEEEIYKRLKPLALRMSAEDYLELPQLVEHDIRVDLPDKARRVYDQLEDDLIAKIDKKVIVAVNAAAASVKCRQVANGGVYLDPEVEAFLPPHRGPKRKWVDLHDEKVDALADLVDELQGDPLLVAYDFEHDLARIKARLGKRVPHIGGGVTPTESNEIVGRWNRGEIPVLLAHPQSVAHGLNLQAGGKHVCWHSLTWNYELYDQFIRRIYRQGTKAKRVIVHRIIAKDTVDEAVIAALRSKERGQKALFEALRSRRRRR